MNSYASSPFSSTQPFSSLLYDPSAGPSSSSISSTIGNTTHNPPASSASPTQSIGPSKSRLLPPHIGTTGLISPTNSSPLPPPYPLSASPTVSGNEVRTIVVELDRERIHSARLVAALEAERDKSNQLRIALRYELKV